MDRVKVCEERGTRQGDVQQGAGEKRKVM